MEDLQFVRKLLEWNGCYWTSHWPPPPWLLLKQPHNQWDLSLLELKQCGLSGSTMQTRPDTSTQPEWEWASTRSGHWPKTSSVIFSKPWSWRQGGSVRTYFYFWWRHWTCRDAVPMATSQPLMPPAIFTKNTLGHWDAYQSRQRQNILFPPCKGFIHPISSFFFNCENDIGF